MVKFGVAASDELKIIGRLLTYKYRHAQGLVSNEFADVVDLLNVSLNGEAYNASHFPNDDAVGLLDSEDPEFLDRGCEARAGKARRDREVDASTSGGL